MTNVFWTINVRMTTAGEECPVCLKQQQLRVAPCGNSHCFCLNCLKQLAYQFSGEGWFRCPLCREPVPIPAAPAGVSNFPIHRPAMLLSIQRPQSRARDALTPATPQTRAAIEWQVFNADARSPRRNIALECRQRAQDLEDEMVARRRAQELEDERVARELQQQENNGLHPATSARPASATAVPRCRPLTSRTRRQIREDEQLANRLQREEHSNHWPTPPWTPQPLPRIAARPHCAHTLCPCYPCFTQCGDPNHAHHAMAPRGGCPELVRSWTIHVETTAPITQVSLAPGGWVQVRTVAYPTNGTPAHFSQEETGRNPETGGQNSSMGTLLPPILGQVGCACKGQSVLSVVHKEGETHPSHKHTPANQRLYFKMSLTLETHTHNNNNKTQLPSYLCG